MTRTVDLTAHTPLDGSTLTPVSALSSQPSPPATTPTFASLVRRITDNIAQVVHEAGALVYVDGVAFAPHRHIDVQALVGGSWQTQRGYNLVQDYRTWTRSGQEDKYRLTLGKVSELGKNGTALFNSKHAKSGSAKAGSDRITLAATSLPRVMILSATPSVAATKIITPSAPAEKYSALPYPQG